MSEGPQPVGGVDDPPSPVEPADCVGDSSWCLVVSSCTDEEDQQFVGRHRSGFSEEVQDRICSRQSPPGDAYAGIFDVRQRGVRVVAEIVPSEEVTAGLLEEF